MNDESVDDPLKHLRAALDVDPSPDLPARVRAALDSGGVVESWSLGAVRFWRWFALPAAAAIVIAVGLAVPTWRENRSTSRSEVSAPRPVAVSTSRPVAPSAPRPRSLSASRRALHVDRVPLTEQEIALLQLLGAIRRGHVLVPAESPSLFESLAAPAPIAVTAIAIHPLPAAVPGDIDRR
jgi:hypothetical protein